MSDEKTETVERGEWHEQRIPDSPENVVDAVLGVSAEQIREAMAAEQEANENKDDQ